MSPMPRHIPHPIEDCNRDSTFGSHFIEFNYCPFSTQAFNDDIGVVGLSTTISRIVLFGDRAFGRPPKF